MSLLVPKVTNRAVSWWSVRHNQVVTSEWLTRALEESRARGFLGPGEVAPHVTHSLGFIASWTRHSPTAPSSFLDLGSGGGLPGLVLLEQWQCDGVLLDSMAKRASFLREVLTWPGSPRGGGVVEGRAEDLARKPELDSSVDLVTSRSFGSPAATAECAVRFLVVGGALIVSEPPDNSSRWDEAGLRRLGLRLGPRESSSATYQLLIKEAETPQEYPRRSGIPGKRPLF